MSETEAMTANPKEPFAPGATLGILGGGQLGRMTAQAAAALGYRTHIYCPEPHCPAAQVTPLVTTAAYDDAAALAAFAGAVDVATFEFENIPLETVEALTRETLVRPRPEVLAICQDRLREKDFCGEHGVATARYVAVDGPEALARHLRDFGTPAVLKTTRLGYDGKGQVRLEADSDPAAAWAAMAGSNPDAQGILEAFVDFKHEVSVIVARGADGEMADYITVENQHENHILRTTIAPARILRDVAVRAEATARRLAEALDLVGLLAVEMFVTEAGEVLVNELAPRPHNSGHWTLDACVTSQFEQLVRAVMGLPLGASERHSDAVMRNLLGDEAEGWRGELADRHQKLHLYGKAEARPGRKMGHVTRVVPKVED